jgi:HSP20 family molecular chaperone IbpA
MFELRGRLSENWPALESVGSDTAIDITETDDAYVMTVDMPGFQTDEIELRSADGQFWLTVEHETEDDPFPPPLDPRADRLPSLGRHRLDHGQLPERGP